MTILSIPPEAFSDRIEGLTDVLHAAVHAGASVNFILPFPRAEAREFWTGKVAAAMDRGRRHLWIAEVDGRVAGCVMLDRDTPPNQGHRGDVTKLLVHPDFRRRGLARQLMTALIDTARAEGLSLLTLDTTTDSPAQSIYAEAGFVVAGSIPAFARAPDRDVLEPTTYMYMAL